MTRLNWERAAEREKYRRTPREDIGRSLKTKRISNAQKKLISTMLKERGIKWSNEINTLSKTEASELISEIIKIK